MSRFAPAYCQQSAAPPALVPEPKAKRIFWIILNFRTSPVLVPYKPMTARQKFHIATLDSFDRGTFALGALFGTEAQLTRANPSFGQGPRYFRRGTGGFWPRLGYAAGQVLWTHGDSGHGQFNVSEIACNSTAMAISGACYRDNRTALDAVSKLGSQLGVDMTSNILKEFWPDLELRLSRKHKSPRD
jgi:hypothetical protein